VIYPSDFEKETPTPCTVATGACAMAFISHCGVSTTAGEPCRLWHFQANKMAPASACSAFAYEQVGSNTKRFGFHFKTENCLENIDIIENSVSRKP